jgi:hypothetical protein
VKAQIVDGKTLKVHEFPFEIRSDRMGLVPEEYGCRLRGSLQRCFYIVRERGLAHVGLTLAPRSSRRR